MSYVDGLVIWFDDSDTETWSPAMVEIWWRKLDMKCRGG
jgi:hypothetical protein